MNELCVIETLIRLQQQLGWDGDWYIHRYPDIAEAIKQQILLDPLLHFLHAGYREGRFPSAHAEQMASRFNNYNILPHDFEVGNLKVPSKWPVTGEIAKTFIIKLVSGFFATYMTGPVILDVGYKGANSNAVPVFPHAIGIDLDYPGYDGLHLPFGDASVDAVFASHVLEHVQDAEAAVREWFRVVKPGGFIVCIVPHQYLYERRRSLPSKWSSEHLRFYTPGSLLCEIETSLLPNSYRIRRLVDNDLGFAYAFTTPDKHASGCYEIELVLERIPQPSWEFC